MSENQQSHEITSDKGHAFLILDAGGIRGISQLEILSEIVKQYNAQVYVDAREKYQRPCEIFDAIIGSGIAGLISIFLVIFGMTALEASVATAKISEDLFSSLNMRLQDRNSILKESIEYLLRGYKIPLDATLLDTHQYSKGCKLLVPVSTRANPFQSTYLRNYATGNDRPVPISIVEACIATLSSLPDFEPVLFRHHGATYEYISGCPNFSNPIREWITDAYTSNRSNGVGCIVSIGSGEPNDIRPSDESDSPEWKYYQESVIRDGQRIGQELGLQLVQLDLYYRFGMSDDTSLDQEGKDTFAKIRSSARRYMLLSENQEKIAQCIDSMRLRRCRITAERLYHLAGGSYSTHGLPPLSKYFVLRKEPWDVIVRTLMGSSGSKLQGQRIVVISGLGGCGKTQLAIRFARVFGSQFESVVFLDGSSESRYRAGLVRYVRSLGPEHSQRSFNEALLFLSDSNFNTERLLIIDNVDDPSMDMEPLLPRASHNAIMITTRNHILGHLASDGHLQLETMPEDEAIEALARASLQPWPPFQESMEEVTRLCSKLGFLPIALAHVGSYMAQTGTSLSLYLSRLEESRFPTVKFPAAGQRDTRRYKSAYAALNLSYKSIAPNTQQVLQLLGMLHWNEIPVECVKVAAKQNFVQTTFQFDDEYPSSAQDPIELLAELFLLNGEWCDSHWETILSTLQDYSFITLTSNSTTKLINIHPVVQMWLSDLTSVSGDQDLLQAACGRLLSCCNMGPFPLDQHSTRSLVGMRRQSNCNKRW
ncbi:hypothetical protein CPB86DRAFT_809401 [Serendipita vermifera]|nr:hypothetical protein CPB86DRAFT_809401 [Serendipita vermifera]